MSAATSFAASFMGAALAILLMTVALRAIAERRHRRWVEEMAAAPSECPACGNSWWAEQPGAAPLRNDDPGTRLL